VLRAFAKSSTRFVPPQSMLSTVSACVLSAHIPYTSSKIFCHKLLSCTIDRILSLPRAIGHCTAPVQPLARLTQKKIASHLLQIHRVLPNVFTTQHMDTHILKQTSNEAQSCLQQRQEVLSGYNTQTCPQQSTSLSLSSPSLPSPSTTK